MTATNPPTSGSSSSATPPTAKTPPLRRLPGARHRRPDRGTTHLPARLHRATRPGTRYEVALVTLVVDAPALDKHPRGTGMLVSEEATAVRAKALTHATAKWQWVADAAVRTPRRAPLLRRGGEDARFSEVALADEQLITLALRDATRMMDVALTRSNLVDADVVRWRGVLPASTPTTATESRNSVNALANSEPSAPSAPGRQAPTGLNRQRHLRADGPPHLPRGTGLGRRHRTQTATAK